MIRDLPGKFSGQVLFWFMRYGLCCQSKFLRSDSDWAYGDFSPIKVSRLALNQNPGDYHVEIEWPAFAQA